LRAVFATGWLRDQAAEAIGRGECLALEEKLLYVVDAYRASIKGAAIPSVDIPATLGKDGTP
jgi:hypothetical protein